jgi:hypothetical protein
VNEEPLSERQIDTMLAAEQLQAYEALKQNKMSLTDFAWRCLWTECGHLWEYGNRDYNLRKIRKLKHAAKRGDSPFPGKFGDRSEWASMVRRWYAHYLQTGEL